MAISDRTDGDGRNASDLEAALRRLPPPAVPEGMEGRLLAAIPARFGAAGSRAASPRRWAFAGGVAVAAAGVLLAVLLWPQQPPVSRPENGPVAASRQEDFRETIDREAASARLVAAARIIAMEMGRPEDAREIVRYAAENYAGTSALRRVPPLTQPSKENVDEHP